MQRRIILLAASLLLLAPLALGVQGADGLSPAEGGAIRQVIQSQLDAFQRDDGASAFSYASPGIQRKFGNPATFMEMVRSGYAAVYRPREVEFRELRTSGSTVQQEVLFVGPDGKAVIAVYTMEKQPDGSWRINGVYFLAAPDETV
ncbi:MAG: DUF4864 domain-containing protein [Kiloniellales bacterium]